MLQGFFAKAGAVDTRVDKQAAQKKD
jgi:hypothetical protein